MEPKIAVQNIAHHRNGVGGVPFYVVLFTDKDATKHQMVGICFEEDDPHGAGYVSPHTAVLDLTETVNGNIAFGEGNSWRGDTYDPPLREAIAKWSAERAAALT